MMNLSNKHNIDLSIVLDLKSTPIENNEGDRIYYVKIGVKAPNQRRQAIGEALPIQIKLTKSEFTACIKDGEGRFDLKPFNNTLIKYRQTINELEEWSIANLKTALNKRTGSKKNAVKDCFDMHYRHLDKRGKKTIMNRTVLRSLLAFNGDILPDWADIDADFLQDWENYHCRVREDGKSNLKGGFKRYMSVMTTVFSIAIEEEYVSAANYPFGKDKGSSKKKFQPTDSESDKFYLSLDQIQAIDAATVGEFKQKHKDLWIFSFYMNGMNFTDIVSLQWKQFDQISGTMTWRRSKGANSGKNQSDITSDVSPRAMEIIKKYSSNETGHEDYIFDIIPNGSSQQAIDNKVHKWRNEKVNKTVREICTVLGFSNVDKIRFGTARNCFANHARSQGFETSEIQKMLGHESILTTEKYLGNLTAKTYNELSEMKKQWGA